MAGVTALATELTGQTRLSDADWNKVEATAQALANALRVKSSTQSTSCFSSVPLRIETIPRRCYSDSVGKLRIARCPGSDSQGCFTGIACT
jgi:hypothetical protein